jgi:hypothetical protein
MSDLVAIITARLSEGRRVSDEDVGKLLARIAELETECTRLRAACDAYFRTISLSQMRHGRILVGLERRNARQRRALAKMYQRRHDKNFRIAELEAALNEIVEETRYAHPMSDVADYFRIARAALTGGKE